MNAMEKIVPTHIREGECARFYISGISHGMWTVEKGVAIQYSLIDLDNMGFSAPDIAELFHRRIFITWAEFVAASY